MSILARMTEKRLFEKFMRASGEKMDNVNLRDRQKGDLFRVRTVSGNTYFFEVVRPELGWAGVFRCNDRSVSGVLSGYRGVRTIYPALFQVGRQIFHNASRTSKVIEIVDISLETHRVARGVFI